MFLVSQVIGFLQLGLAILVNGEQKSHVSLLTNDWSSMSQDKNVTSMNMNMSYNEHVCTHTHNVYQVE
ncbi:hypothetical protein BLOT_015074 [Blomia tropicalis]|nr:hypothetical protein BLOT_015074 [Blomia tropicalis]